MINSIINHLIKGKSNQMTQVFTGVGVDLISIKRVAATLESFPNRFARKILTQLEYDLMPIDPKLKTSYLAKRFAAKEALSKALGTGIGKKFGFQDVSILKRSSGQPYYELTGLKTTFMIREAHLSLTDDYPWVMAFCVLVAESEH